MLELGNEDAVRPTREQPRQVGFAHRQRERAQIVTVVREDVESKEPNFMAVLAGVGSIEIGDTVDAEHHSLTADHEG